MREAQRSEKPGETPREATTNRNKGGVQQMTVNHCQNVELVFRRKLQKHDKSHTNCDECQGSATNADSCEEQQKVIHDSKHDKSQINRDQYEGSATNAQTCASKSIPVHYVKCVSRREWYHNTRVKREL